MVFLKRAGAVPGAPILAFRNLKIEDEDDDEYERLLLLHQVINQQHSGGGEEAVEAEEFPATGFEPVGEPF